MEMGKVLLIIAMWFFGFLMIWVMKKIEPDNRWYSVWVLVVLTLFTLVNVVWQ